MDSPDGTEPVTPTAMSAAPETVPGGLSESAKTTDILSALLAFRDNWETWRTKRDEEKVVEKQRMDSMRSGLNLLQGEMVVLQEDVKASRSAAEAARLLAEQGKQRAEEAHALADGATQATRFISQDHEGDKQALLAALTETRGTLSSVSGQLTDATKTIGDLRKTDEELKAMVEEAAKNSAGAAIREVVGKNPKVIGALGVILVVLANILSQRFLLPPAAPNQGALPAQTPTVHVEAP